MEDGTDGQLLIVQSQTAQSLLFWTSILRGLFWVLPFSPNRIHAETNHSVPSNEILAVRVECRSQRRWNKRCEFCGIIEKSQTESSVLFAAAPTVSLSDLKGEWAVLN